MRLTLITATSLVVTCLASPLAFAEETAKPAVAPAATKTIPATGVAKPADISAVAKDAQMTAKDTLVNPASVKVDAIKSTEANNTEKTVAAEKIVEPKETVKFDAKKPIDKLSYTIGVDMGQNFLQQDIKINPEILLIGLTDVLKKRELKMKPEEMEMTLQVFQKQLFEKREAKKKSQAASNKETGTKFLTENKTKEGVVTLPSGLQYKVVTPGQGQSPSVSSLVTVKYTGKLLNGEVFDSTDGTGKPVSFRVSDVIPGWTEALQVMKPGAKFDVFIPSDLAYGEQGIMGVIGPNETLLFSIELISVKDEAKQNVAPAVPASGEPEKASTDS